MNILSVYVTPFSKKIILSRNNNTQPIKLSASDSLAGALCCVKPGNINKAEKTKALLTEPVEIVCNGYLVSYINSKKIWRAGLFVNDLHREELNNYISAKVEMGVGATRAIYDFCAKYNIEIDVDINFETLYKDWQRFERKKVQNSLPFLGRKSQTKTCIGGKKTYEKLIASWLYSDEELDAIINSYYIANQDFFFTLHGEPRKKLKQQLELYVYRIIGNRSVSSIGNKFNFRKKHYYVRTGTQIKRSDHDSKIRKNIFSFKMFLNTAPPLILPNPSF